MPPLLHEFDAQIDAGRLCGTLGSADQPVLLRSGGSVSALSRYSLLAAFPMVAFSSQGARCEWLGPSGQVQSVQFGNPWQLLSAQLARYELVDEPDLPFPTGGCFGFWGYDLKQFVEPRVGRIAHNDLELPDCRIGYYPSCLVWDRQLNRAWIVATGLSPDGARSTAVAQRQVARWLAQIAAASRDLSVESNTTPASSSPAPAKSSVTRENFLRAVDQALEYIRLGHIYQVNLAQRWSRAYAGDAWQLFERLSAIAPAPFAAYQAWDDTAIISSSPEKFLHMSAREITTRPIKGTRPRSPNPDEDARLSYELQSSTKERAELVMITDLLRNDLGRVCDYGTVHVPELLRLERYSHVQHLVSTVSGRLRAGLSHLDALAACFPGGSITGAPKIRAMQIIDELEPVSRGPYTGSLGYLGFNRESQLNILIRTALVTRGSVHYHAGAGIVADSSPEAEFEETLVKARAFFQALEPATSQPRARAGAANQRSS
jgi:aminodeoxychorismate synthase component I